MRTFAAVVAGMMLAGATVAVLGAAAPAGAETPGAGTYVALASPTRVLDTRTGINGGRKTPLKAREALTVRVSGIGSVPPTGVGSVVISLRAVGATANGGLVAYGAQRPATTNLQFVRGVDAGASAVVPVTTTGTIAVASQATTGTVGVAAEVTGYYRAGTPSATDHGVFHPLAKAQRLMSQTVAGRHSVSPVAGGKFGIPADAGAVAATLTVSGTAAAGSLASWRTSEPSSSLPALRWQAGRAASGFAVLPLGSGQTTLYNQSAGSAVVALDIVGYYSEGVAQTAGTLRPVPATQVLSTSVGASGSTTVTLAGKGGVPLTKVRSAVVTIDVTNAKASGTVQLSRYGTGKAAGTAAVTFARGVPTATTTLVPLSGGKFSLFTTASAASSVTVSVRGYVPDDTVSPPAGFVGRYPNQLVGQVDFDRAVMRDDGIADARAGSRFVLLDLGAQSISPPTLSPGNAGIVLAQTGSKRIAIPYADLVSDLTAYLQAYAETAPGLTATVAVGTNNDGAFDPAGDNYYAADARGRHFADLVIDPLRAAAPAGITVVGANDIESGYASTYAQALAWENAYFGATPATLIYNGSLDGCPATFGSTAACANGWTQAQYVTLTTNKSRVLVLPQVYVRNQSVQWANVDRTGGGKLRYVGVLTESLDDNTFTAAQGWTAFVRALASVRTTSPPAGLASVDIQKDDQRNVGG